MEKGQTITVHERDESGYDTKTYLISSAGSIGSRDSEGIHASIIPAEKTNVVHSSFIDRTLRLLVDVFMPAGYPGSVSSDYFNYQLYDSLQAFSSSIAGLLASRAVLEGFGVGDASASATTALLITITQDAISRLATILFAWRIGTALEPEAKRYRLLADIFNDTSMILDCLSPALPKTIRVFALCVSGAFRALCGVAAGGAKAALSVHFARANNIGDLNAKDSSQETVIGLLGMLAGSFLVARITTPLATWSLLLLLLSVHLLMNYLAVRSVTMLTLNRQRATIVYSTYRATGAILTPTQVSKKEYIFARGGKLYKHTGVHIGYCKIEKSFQQLVSKDPHLSQLLHIFSDERYILSFVAGRITQLRICLRNDATSVDNLRSWIHALELAHLVKERSMTSYSASYIADMIKESHGTISRIHLGLFEEMKMKGWDMNCDAIITRQINRFRIVLNPDGQESKKDI